MCKRVDDGGRYLNFKQIKIQEVSTTEVNNTLGFAKMMWVDIFRCWNRL